MVPKHQILVGAGGANDHRLTPLTAANGKLEFNFESVCSKWVRLESACLEWACLESGHLDSVA